MAEKTNGDTKAKEAVLKVEKSSTVNQIAEIEKTLEAMEKKEAQAEAEEKKRMEAIETKCKEEITNRMTNLDHQFQHTFQDRMSNMERRYSDHTTGFIKSIQTDVLRINKIIRDTSRPLGPDWRPVFRRLTEELPPEEVDTLVDRIESQKPFMQAYHALMTWKELCGDEIQVHQLADALKDCGQVELANKIYDILDSEGDSLIKLDGIGKGIRSSLIFDDCTADSIAAQANGTVEGATAGPGGAKPLTRPMPIPEYAIDPISDNNMLKLSRKLVSKWQELGTELKVPEEELQEIRAAEDGHQAAFKMLWSWRAEAQGDYIDQLIQALKKVGADDLVAIIQPPAS